MKYWLRLFEKHQYTNSYSTKYCDKKSRPIGGRLSAWHPIRLLGLTGLSTEQKEEEDVDDSQEHETASASWRRIACLVAVRSAFVARFALPRRSVGSGPSRRYRFGTFG